MNQKRAIIFFLALISAGCGQVGFGPANGKVSLQGINFLDDVKANTLKNVPVSFIAGTTAGERKGALSFSNTRGYSSIETANGRFEIMDAVAFTVQYTPNHYFVGRDQVLIYAIDSYGKAPVGTITVTVGNIINQIQPALAVKGPACIICHSRISSNMIVDFGFGQPWYFNNGNLAQDSFYADRVQPHDGIGTLDLMTNSLDQKPSRIFVPKAKLPDLRVPYYPGDTTLPSNYGLPDTIDTLAKFVSARFDQGALDPLNETPKPSSTQSQQVVEASSVKINLPSEKRILEAFGNPTSNTVYFPDTLSSPSTVTGANFDSSNNVFLITDLTCDGDLFLRATVLFENAVIRSINGCRIYTSGSVFIDGTFRSEGIDGSTTHNIQLLSSRSIWLGTGWLWKNGAFCEPKGWYVGPTDNNIPNCKDPTMSDREQCNTFVFRMGQLNNRISFTENYRDNNSFLDTKATTPSFTELFQNPLGWNPGNKGLIYQEYYAAQRSLGSPLFDASCNPGIPNGRRVDLNRVLLAAPYVNSRLVGNFSGAVITEVGLMSLWRFVFQFDPVFVAPSVSIFSLLEPNEIIDLVY